MHKILFVTCCPSPSRVDFFNSIGKDNSIDLTVVFMESEEEQHHRSPKWFAVNKFENFKCVFLHDRVGNKNKQYYGYVSKDIIKELKKEYDEIIFGGYAYPTFMFGMLYLINRRIPYSIEVDGGFVSKDSLFKQKIKKYYIGHANKWYSSGKNTDKYLVYYGAKESGIIHYPFTSLTEKDFCRAWDCNKSQLKEFLSSISSNPNVFYKRKKTLKHEACTILSIPEKKVIVTIGQFIHRKGFDVLLDAAKGIDSDIIIYIIGGVAPLEYTKYVEDNRLTNVFFVDFLSKEEMKIYLWAADLFVLPTRMDIWGLVINEAMAYGLPIISTDKCNSALELVSDNNGTIIPSDDALALKNAINNYFENYLSDDMGRNSLLKIQNYTIENMAKRHIEIWGDLNENNS